MTPPARYAAAIEILDRILDGVPAEKALTNWARASRFAGSKDRAAIRDIVFDALRCRRSYGVLGNGATGRALVLGGVRAQGCAPEEIFGAGGYGPDALTDLERAEPPSLMDVPDPVRLDCPDWMWPQYEGPDREAILLTLRQRADVFLRVNLRKATRQATMEALAREGITAEPHALSPTALKVTDGARKVQRCAAYMDGRVELQDAGSQAISDLVPLTSGDRVLDYCAGGGGKSLALAARADITIHAHDLDPKRMSDIPLRAKRAGVEIDTIAEPKGPYDVVICDVPCSGSGAYGRAPMGKWSLTPERLADLTKTQAQILREGAALTRGYLIYMTCSVFAVENHAQIEAFLQAQIELMLLSERLISPLEGGDGFYVAVLKKA